VGLFFSYQPGLTQAGVDTFQLIDENPEVKMTPAAMCMEALPVTVNPHDPRPQASIRTTSGTGETEPTGPYVDKSLTQRNPVNADPDAPFPPSSGSTTLGDVRPVYASDHATEIVKDAAIDNDPSDVPNSPNSWQIEDVNGVPRSRDYYRNDGMIGQDDFLKNQGS
jgi:hypothetical protein